VLLCSFPRIFFGRRVRDSGNFLPIGFPADRFIGRFSVFTTCRKARVSARLGRRRLVAPADASMIFSGGKTCRKLRALLPNMKDDRSSLSAGASSREWCV